jgi:uncharacterized damage-inducible protein DinB
MTAYQLIEDKVRYHQWANQKMINWLEGCADDLLLASVIGSFASLNKLLHHMLEAETYYLSILTGTKGVYYDELSSRQIFSALSEVDEKLLAWLFSQDPEVVANRILLKRSAHEEQYTVATLILHIVNHGSYHRGQIVDFRHQLGISDPPKTDYYWMFAEELLRKNSDE